jgi:hypothetical protein
VAAVFFAFAFAAIVAIKAARRMSNQGDQPEPVSPKSWRRCERPDVDHGVAVTVPV